MIDIQKVDRMIDWADLDSSDIGSTQVAAGLGFKVEDVTGRCDHETCYETHDINLILSHDGRYFLKSWGYHSQDGFQNPKPLREVKAVEKTVRDWEDVPVYVWDEAGISKFLIKWMNEQPGSRYSSYDWTSLYYAAQVGLEIPGFPYAIRAVETFENHEPESNGPVWLIFEINGEHYAAKGRNVSHVGWDFDSVYALEKVGKKTVTQEVWQ